MRTKLFFYRGMWFLLIAGMSHRGWASHAQATDITYQCLGNNQYQVTVAFYRDCAGANAPNTITLNVSSQSCNQNFNVTLTKVPGTGIQITQVCNQLTTTCNGGTYPGVQEFKYTAVVTLPLPCADWTFSYSLCCRNNAINTIVNPGGQNIYVSALVNTLDFTCNNSPQFSNPPLAFPCVGQTTCFNHGAVDPDNDSLYYSLVAPQTGANTTVTYINPYTAQQPLPSNPPVTINPVTGDICMSPTMQIVTVTAVRIEEWKDGKLKGRIQRDIQIRSINCNNTLPTLLGIDGSGQFTDTVCAGVNNTFQIPSFDPDANQVVTMTWNNGISGATFTVNNNNNPTGTFSWTPSYNQISNQPYCFTVTVQDNACPFNGVQTFSFCLYVKGFQVQTTATPANCGASNGTATAIVTGGIAPFTYQWSNQGSNGQATAYGLSAGTYTVTVSDASGCSYTQSVTVPQGAAPGNINIVGTNVSCYGGANGSAVAQVNGGQPPYTYLWNTGATTQGINGLTAGTYWVTVTTNQGCVKTDTIIITQPPQLLISVSVTPVTCYGFNDGSAQVIPAGGTPPYQYAWNGGAYTGNGQNNNLSAGQYTVSVQDVNGCTVSQSFSVTQPSPITANIMVFDVTCYGGSDGSASVAVSGGVGNYTITWNTTPLQYGTTAQNLIAGNYSVTIADNNNCQQTFNLSVNQPAPLLSTVTYYKAVSCFGGSDGSIAVLASGGTPPYQYSWNTIPVQSTNMATNLSAGNYMVTIIDANSCVYTDTFTITEPAPMMSMVVSNNATTCFGLANGSASILVSGGIAPYTIMWNTTPVQTGNTLQNVPAGTYQATVTDANNCVLMQAVTITQPSPVVITTYPYNDTVCPGQSVNLAVSATGGVGGYTYSWSTGAGGPYAIVNPLVTAQYYAIVADSNGCVSDTAYFYVFVNDIANVGIQITGDTDVCEGESTVLTALLNNGIGNYLYNWQYAGNQIGNPLMLTPLQSGWVYLTIQDICFNVKKDSVWINVNPLPLISIAPQHKQNCGAVEFELKNMYPWNNITQVQWIVSNQQISTDTVDSFVVSESGMYNVWCYVTDNKGCQNKDSAQFWALIFPQVYLDFSYTPQSPTVLDARVEFYSIMENTDNYQWNFGDGTISLVENPVHTYQEKGVYTVTLYGKNKYGCENTIAKEIEIFPEFSLYIPNAFSPDNDGRNDVFIAKGEEIEEYTMQIFNRWGALIFESHDIQKGWDGSIDGKAAPIGVYTYKVWVKDFRGHFHEYLGSVTLIK